MFSQDERVIIMKKLKMVDIMPRIEDKKACINYFNTAMKEIGLNWKLKVDSFSIDTGKNLIYFSNYAEIMIYLEGIKKGLELRE